MRDRLQHLEKDTGIKFRVLAQNYPDTPGMERMDFMAWPECAFPEALVGRVKGRVRLASLHTCLRGSPSVQTIWFGYPACHAHRLTSNTFALPCPPSRPGHQGLLVGG